MIAFIVMLMFSYLSGEFVPDSTNTFISSFGPRDIDERITHFKYDWHGGYDVKADTGTYVIAKTSGILHQHPVSDPPPSGVHAGNVFISMLVGY